MKIGHGYDVHGYTEGDFIVLGGVRIPFSRSFKAHSDGDVLIHALCDALLGAMGLGDIGVHFPDSDSQFENVDSRLLLRKVYDMLDKAGLVLANADMTIIAQQPKLVPFFSEMKNNLATDLHVAESQINLKATTTEGLGFIGREEGVAAHAVVLLLPQQEKS